MYHAYVKGIEQAGWQQHPEKEIACPLSSASLMMMAKESIFIVVEMSFQLQGKFI